MSRFYLFLFTFIVFFSCKKEIKNEYKATNFKQESKINQQVIREDFNVFFRKFGRDSIFQIERLKDSVNYITRNENDKLKTKKYSKKDFSFRDYTKDSLAYKEKYNGYTVELERKEDSICYYLWGVDNGIHRFYVFKRNSKSKNWFLNSIHNYSH